MNVLLAIVPVFTIILGGWLATRLRYVSETVEKGLTEYVFSIAGTGLDLRCPDQAGRSW